MIRVDNLRKAYGETVAVDGVSFETAPGETFGLLGPNGAGKTTTMSMLAGVLRPDAGQVRINNGDDPASPAGRRGVGIAPQSLSLYSELTGQENLRFFARIFGVDRRRLADRVHWALEFAQLEDHRRKRVGAYSGGMKRRLNMACALIHDPSVILFDEPTVGVDPQSRNHIFEKIEELKGQGRSILYTTHYMEEAERLCDRVAIMDHGKILAMDTVAALIDQHGGHSVVSGELEEVSSHASLQCGGATGKSFSFDTEDALGEISRLAADGVKFRSLSIHEPDLESVFLALTGRRLRDR